MTQRLMSRIIQDWPPSRDFQEAFPRLYTEFANAIPVPGCILSNGVRNLASHYPLNSIKPDLGE
jgi:lysine-specific demethylase 3